jgi:phage shock protein A
VASSGATFGPDTTPSTLAPPAAGAYLVLMFDDLQRIFRQSISAFRAELSRREPEDEVADLLSAMRREWVAARAELPVLAETLQRARAELAREQAQLEQCQRRGAAAERSGDQETVRVAREFEERHRARAGVLEDKLRALEGEQALRLREVEEMKQRYQQADANRHGLVAELRRARRGDHLGSIAAEGADAAEQWERISERIQSDEAVADALDELDPPRPAPPSGAAVEERLRELKRRMGRE